MTSCKQSSDVIFYLYVFDLSPKIAISTVKAKGSIVPIKNDFKELDQQKKSRRYQWHAYMNHKHSI